MSARGRPALGWSRAGEVGVEPALREWTRFAWRGWRDATAPAPAGPPPVEALRNLGLAPVVFRLLRRRDDARAAAFGDSHRNTAGSNLLQFARVARARDALAARGITPVLIKGAAFVLRYSPGDAGVRAFADLDLLVGPARFDVALEVLTTSGWRRGAPGLRYSSRVAPAIALVADDPSGMPVQLDLHRGLAQWPLLRRLPAKVMAAAEILGGWPVCSARHLALVAALHRARHAFANDARDLFDTMVATGGLDDASWAGLMEEAAAEGLTGALYGTMRQAAWWFAADEDAALRRVAALRRALGPVRRALLDRMADPALPLTRSSKWSGPAGRNFAVFPAAFHAPFASLVAAAVFLPRRVIEGR